MGVILDYRMAEDVSPETIKKEMERFGNKRSSKFIAKDLGFLLHLQCDTDYTTGGWDMRCEIYQAVSGLILPERPEEKIVRLWNHLFQKDWMRYLDKVSLRAQFSYALNWDATGILLKDRKEVLKTNPLHSAFSELEPVVRIYLMSRLTVPDCFEKTDR